MTDEQVEAVGRGRVWTGEQALAHSLVDQLGDLRAAAAKARELAGLDPRRYVPLIPVPPPKHYQLPRPVAVEAGEWLAGLSRLIRDGVFALAPWRVHFRG
jgi:ClpP class serine protease